MRDVAYMHPYFTIMNNCNTLSFNQSDVFSLFYVSDLVPYSTHVGGIYYFDKPRSLHSLILLCYSSNLRQDIV